MDWSHLIFYALLIAIVTLTIVRKKLTVAGAVGGGILAIVIYLGGGWTGVAMLGLFFALSVTATRLQKNVKRILGVPNAENEQRTLGQVLANGGVAAIMGILAFALPQHKEIFLLMLASGLSSATADTLSSELGTIYGSRFYNILNFKNDRRGENGVVSLEGTMLGFMDSGMIAFVYSLGYGWSAHFSWIVIAGTIGNLVDSLLGATLERKGKIGNDLVNFLNTLAAATVAFFLAWLQRKHIF